MNHPVALTVYNRPEHTARVLDALRKYDIQSLYIFSDGAKIPTNDHGSGAKTVNDHTAVRDVRALITSIDWTAPELVFLRDGNLGLARSMVAAVDHVLAEHETVIVLEDDCVPGPYFLTFMDECLGRYRDDSSVLGVTGYTVPVPGAVLDSYAYDCYSFPRIGSWGWATWRERWQSYERDVPTAYERAKRCGGNLTAGGKDIPGLIECSIAGQLDAWTPGWLLANALTRTYYIYPTVSHITNIGYDGSGVHCGKSNRYDTPIAKTRPTRFPARAPKPDRRIVENFKRYY